MSTRTHIDQLIKNLVEAEANMASFEASGWDPADRRRLGLAIMKARHALDRALDKIVELSA